MDDLNDETLVLSAFVKNPSLVLNYYIPEQAFSSQVNEKLFSNLVKIAKEIKSPDYNVVVSYLKSGGLLDVCGGKQYLAYLKDIQVSVENLDIYVRNLIDNYKKRSFFSYIKNFYNADVPTESINDVLTRVIDKITDIALLNPQDKILDITQASDIAFDTLEKRLKENKIITSGYKHIDAVTGGLYPGDLWYVAGRPGMGKTAWCINAINRQAEEGIPTLLISLEMSISSLVYRLLAIRTGIPILKMKLGVLTRKELDTLKEEKDKIASLPIYIDNNFDSDIAYITSVIHRQHLANKIKVVHLDYLQLISIRDINNSVKEYSKISRELKVLANKLGISIVAYSQLTRNTESRNDKRPLLHDLRESGGLEQDADVVIMLYRDEIYNQDSKYKNQLENIIRKQREGELGVLYSKFYGDTNRIEEEL
jgi:replicative DNA helicase